MDHRLIVKRTIAAVSAILICAGTLPADGFIRRQTNNTAITAYAAEYNFSDYATYKDEAGAVFLISSYNDLTAFANAVNGGNTFAGKNIKLADNFDMGANALTTSIGSSSHHFKGTFDGNGKTIKLNINMPINFYVGLFGYADGATIRNVTVTGTVTGNTDVGGVTGGSINTTIYNCVNKADITTVSGCYGGGIIGYTKDSSIYNCYNTGAISTNAEGAGGIVGGANTGNSYIYNCYNTGTAKTSSNNKGGMFGYTYNFGKIFLSSWYKDSCNRLQG